MTPPPALTDSVVRGYPDRSHPSASVGGVVSEWGGMGAGRGVSTPPIVVKPAIGIITTDLRPILGDNHYQNYRDFLRGGGARDAHDGRERPHATTPFAPARSISGAGQQTKDACGSVRHWAACSKDKGHGARPLVEHCDDPECPVCWKGWGVKQARKVSERLRGYITAARPEGRWFTSQTEDQMFEYYDPEQEKFWSVGHCENAQNVRHFLLSAPEGALDPWMSTAHIYAVGKFWAKWVGIRGGMMAFHPWRILPEIQERLKKLIPRGLQEGNEEYEKKFWQVIREQSQPDRSIDLGLESWHCAVYWSPHFHIIGFGYICDSINFRELTGWLVKEVRNISQKKEWDGRRMKDDIAAVSFYVLSHGNVEWGKKSVAWIGCMTPNNLKRLKEKPIEDRYPIECKKCQAQEIVYCQTLENVPGDPSIGRDGQYQWLYYKERLYRYRIVTRREKDEQREERKRRKGPPGFSLPVNRQTDTQR